VRCSVIAGLRFLPLRNLCVKVHTAAAVALAFEAEEIFAFVDVVPAQVASEGGERCPFHRETQVPYIVYDVVHLAILLFILVILQQSGVFVVGVPPDAGVSRDTVPPDLHGAVPVDLALVIQGHMNIGNVVFR